ncbi:unnamed protein product [Peniophora sp. CBMAI 1063]|nr:unnamed protein product [Peniophora sp. CBMAI 1063]
MPNFDQLTWPSATEDPPRSVGQTTSTGNASAGSEDNSGMLGSEPRGMASATPFERMLALRDLAWERVGGWAWFAVEEKALYKLQAAREEILIQGWLEARRTGSDPGFPITDQERALQACAIEREREFAEATRISQLDQSQVDPELWQRSAQFLRWWTGLPPRAAEEAQEAPTLPDD